jgi:hypothetical protein
LSLKATELLTCLQQIKTHIRTKWLLPLPINNEYENDSDLLKVDNQQRLDEWQHVALVLDRLFFLLFIIAMPCTALLFVSAHLSITTDFRSNLTNIKLQSVDAKCDLLYKPILV